MRRRLTELSIEKLKPPEKGRLEIFDDVVPSLALRVTVTGAKSFVVRTRIKGRPEPIRLTLGDAVAMDLRSARQEASDLLRICRAGDDPRAIIRAKADEAVRRHRNTFRAVTEQFIGAHFSKLRSGSHAESAIRRYLIPEWHSRTISSITPADVGQLIQKLLDDGSPHTARRILAHAKNLFQWAADPVREYVKVDPTANISAKTFKIVTSPRQTVLSPEHLRLIWKAAGEMDGPFGQCVRLLMLSGQRRDEIARLSWPELDQRDKVLGIPADRMKAKRPHEIPLSTPMDTMLADLREDRGTGEYIFSTTDGAKPISGYSKAKAELDRRIAEIREQEAAENGQEPPKDALPAWRLHDLRRTVRTGLGALPAVPHDIRELVIAHVPPALVRTYDVHAYREEKRQALELWAQRLKQIVDPPDAKADVVSLHATGAAQVKRGAR
jgi:integrase